MRKRVLLGVTGGIAVYKAVTVVSMLVKAGIDVVVIMTDSACRFVTPLTFETMSKNRVITDMFSRDYPYEVEHVSLAKSSDLVLIAPATANFIGKVVSGVADDMLTTTYMACKGIKLVCPAMNTNMYNDEFFQKNLEEMRCQGTYILEPNTGILACGDIGKGRLCEPEEIVAKVLELLKVKNDYEGKNVLVTAGATIETIDGVRYISNQSSGRMGIAIADEAYSRGANVTLIAGKVSVNIPKYINTIRVESTEDMYNAVLERVEDNDIIIKAAAPADYRVKQIFDNKVKTDTLTLELVKTPDIAKAVGEIKKDKKLVIFSAETENLIENAKCKLLKKNADMVVANDVTLEGAGFNCDTNIVTLITREKEEHFDKLPKTSVANIILDKVLELK